MDRLVRRFGPLTARLIAVVAVAGLSGCTMCPDPYDYSGPVPNGSVPQNDFRARSGGILPLGASPRPWPPLVKQASADDAQIAGSGDGARLRQVTFQEPTLADPPLDGPSADGSEATPAETTSVLVVNSESDDSEAETEAIELPTDVATEGTMEAEAVILPVAPLAETPGWRSRR
ncbi:MAG: hypothetical protein ACR2IT_03000 [Pirellulales bacterium]